MPEDVAPPAMIGLLLQRALAEAPGNPKLHVKLGHLNYDRHDYAAAADSFAAATRLDPAAPDARRMLARCYNHLHRHEEALVAAGGEPDNRFERCRALMELKRLDEAEHELRAILAQNPDNGAACRLMCRLLRRSGRFCAMVAICEELAERGAGNAQLLYNWGEALARKADYSRSRHLMFDPKRVVSIDLPVPAGFADIVAFNAALADDILENPQRVSRFVEDEANRGSCRVDNLFTGRRPELITALLTAFQKAIDGWHPKHKYDFDPWFHARPATARLRPWGLIQRNEDYEEGHIHPGGWLSGVYYVRVPAAVSDSPEPGPGCIEFGPPSGLGREVPDLERLRRYRPREGMLLLSPSHFEHRTIPSGVDNARISVAFDVVADTERASKR